MKYFLVATLSAIALAQGTNDYTNLDDSDIFAEE